jgi:putative transposase
VIPGIPHHITHRGNNRQEIFFDDDDRRLYLKLLARYTRECGLEVMGYSLMSTHTHVVGIPEQETSLALAIGQTDYQYSLYFNKRYGRIGHLWQNRFYSCPMDDEHADTALVYVDRNAFRAKICERPWEYSWCSAQAHITLQDPTGLLNLTHWAQRTDFPNWQILLGEEENDTFINTIRNATFLGRPLGSTDFITRLEAQVGYSLQPKPVGRPPKYRRK